MIIYESNGKFRVDTVCQIFVQFVFNRNRWCSYDV